MHCDSLSVIDLEKIMELITFGQILLRRVHTLEDAIDMLTKTITTDRFKRCLDLLNVA